MSDELNKKMVRAVREGDVASSDKYLSEGADPQFHELPGYSAFKEAARFGHKLEGGFF